MLGSIIIGVGSKSSQLTDKLLEEIASGPKNHGIIAVGVYTGPEGGKLRGRIHAKSRQLRVIDISIDPTVNPKVADRVLDDLVELQRNVARLEPESVLLVVDASIMNEPKYAEVFHLLRATLQQRAKMSALCLVDDPRTQESALNTLKKYTVNSPTTSNNPILDAVFVARTTGSPLFHASGGANPQMNLLAKSMAQIWEANLYYNFNPTFDDQVKLARQSGYAFIGLAIGSVRLSRDENQGLFARLFKPTISGDKAKECLIQLTDDLLNDRPEARTSINDPTRKLNLAEVARSQYITVNIILPLKVFDPRFDGVRDGIQRGLRERGYEKLAYTSMIPGNGALINVKPQPLAAAVPTAITPMSYDLNANPRGGGYAPNDYGQSGYSHSGYSQSGYAPNDYQGYPSAGVPTPAFSPPDASQYPSGSVPRPLENPTGAEGTDGAVQKKQKNTKDKYIGQVCVLFGITPEQI